MFSHTQRVKLVVLRVTAQFSAVNNGDNQRERGTEKEKSEIKKRNEILEKRR